MSTIQIQPGLSPGAPVNGAAQQLAILKRFAALLPDDTQLPDSDGQPVENFQEHPQGILLTESIKPVLDRIHPDGLYLIGQNSGIYFNLTEPRLLGAKAPDWFYIPGVPGLVKGRHRRSYVLWKELIIPYFLLEFVSGDGSEEHDRTPNTGKFWVYETVLQTPFYGIFDGFRETFEMYQLVESRYELMSPNKHGRYALPAMQVEIGLWRGAFFYKTPAVWLRFWDQQGNMLLDGHEQAEIDRAQMEREKRVAEQERQRAEAESQRAERLAARLRELGVDPDQ